MAKNEKTAAPAEKKEQTYINFFRNPETGKSTLMGPFKTPSDKEYYTSDYKDNQRVMIPGKIVKAKKDGTGYFINGSEDFLKSQKLNVSVKGEDGKYGPAGEITLADYAEYREAQNQAYRAKVNEAKAAEKEGAEVEAPEADGPEA